MCDLSLVKFKCCCGELINYNYRHLHYKNLNHKLYLKKNKINNNSVEIQIKKELCKINKFCLDFS